MGCGSSSSPAQSKTTTPKPGQKSNTNSRNNTANTKNTTKTTTSQNTSNKNNQQKANDAKQKQQATPRGQNKVQPEKSNNNAKTTKPVDNKATPRAQQAPQQKQPPKQPQHSQAAKQGQQTQRSQKNTTPRQNQPQPKSPEPKPKEKKKPTEHQEMHLSEYKIPNSQTLFTNQALAEHNKLRRTHNAPDLTLNHELCKLAVDYARVLASSNRILASDFRYKNTHVGENLLMYADSNLSVLPGDFATQQWYNEGKDYPYDGKARRSRKHFTQLIWKASKECGFGVAKASNGSFYCCALYWPAGNVEGHYSENVQK